MEFIGYILAGWLLIALVFVAYGREKTWVKIFGAADLGAVDFATFSPSKKPNHALFCPDDYCPNAKKYKLSPVFDIPVAELKARLMTLIEAEDHIVNMASDEAQLEYRFVHYTALMRYPDTINLKFIDLTDEPSAPKSTVAIFSESQIGQSDLGVNYKRIDGWLKKLATH